MKKYFLSLFFIAAGFPVFAAINHGSITGNGLPLYPVRNGATPGIAVEGVTFDFKAVTVGTKTWVWTNLNGKSIAGNNWSSQFRFRYPAIQEYNLFNRIANTQQTYGIVGIPDINFCEPPISGAGICMITFLQETNDGFYETADLIYNYAQPNSAVANDQTPPVLNTPTVVDRTDRQVRLLLSATDDSGNFFYYIEDAANNFAEVSFSDDPVLNLEPDINYHFSIYAVDFSGNQSQGAAVSQLNLPDSIKNSSDFYIIYMDAESEASLGSKVKEKNMLRDYDIWNGNMTGGNGTGINAWGWEVSVPWVNWVTTNASWNGGAIVANLSEFGRVPDLKAITDNPADYYFHFAIKSPATQPDAGWTLILYSDSTSGDRGLKYYVGPQPDNINADWLGNYAHDGEWHHFEIPVSELKSKGYEWGGPLSAENEKVYLLGFQSPDNVPGTELNLDAIFFYKKQLMMTEGTARAISFKLDSRSLSELQIECTSNDYIAEAFVELELNGKRVEGQWKVNLGGDPNSSGAKEYSITVLASAVPGWAKDAILGLNLGYKLSSGEYVYENKVITAGKNAGLPILHKIGMDANPDVPLPDSIKNGSNFYIIYMDTVNEASLGSKVKEKTMFRSYDILTDGETLTAANRTGMNAWGVSVPWMALDVTSDAETVGWNGGAVVADLNLFDKAPNLKAVTDSPDDYYFHFAIKSPATQPTAGWTLILYSDSTSGDKGLKYYAGPQSGSTDADWLGDYTHDGEWHHFEIPVSELKSKGYEWGGPMSAEDEKVYLLGFQSPDNVSGTELNLDAVFFYKKQLMMTEGTARAISFKLDSHSLSELKIECTSNDYINEAFVELELNGKRVEGQWKANLVKYPIVSSAKEYLITVPASAVRGWAKDAILGLNLGYKPFSGEYVYENKVITAGKNAGLPILHKIGMDANPDPPEPNLPDSIKNGSDFYIIYMDTVNEASLGSKVIEKTMLRDYDIWNGNMIKGDGTGSNAWGLSVPWVSLVTTNASWNGGAIVTILDKFSRVPDLTAITDNPCDYYFHFAIKSPATQPDAGWTLMLYSDSTSGDKGLKYYVGPDTESERVRGLPWLGNYTHDGEWQHFEIPVSQLKSKGYVWDGPMSAMDGRVPLLGFQSLADVSGTELNLDAVFFYKKPTQSGDPVPDPVVMTEGIARAISFKLDSRSLSELKIECTSDDFISDAFVKFELNGVGVAGRWKPVIAVHPAIGTKKYLITIPTSEIHGWAEGAILGLNFGYTSNGTYVDDNKIITSGDNAGKRILHKIGTSAYSVVNLPDSIKNGSDFYIIYMDAESEASLGSKVKEKSMLRSYDIWPNGETLTVNTRTGVNAWGVDVSVPWVSFDVASSAFKWNGGAIVAVLNQFGTVPDLRAVTDNPNDYYFHFAIKSPDNQPDVIWMVNPYCNDSTCVEYYVGPENYYIGTFTPATWLGNYAHDGQWHHFEIPVSDLKSKNFVWTGPLSSDKGRAYLLGFQAWRNVVASERQQNAEVGTELNLDAIFFYKKP